MSMSKQDFIALAEYIRDTENYCEPFTQKQIEHLANFCRSQNYRFLKGRWLGYIAGENGKNGGAIKKAA